MIFYSLIKPVIKSGRVKEYDLISTPAALQIAGRAGRYQTNFSEGEVTTFRTQDLQTLVKILNTPIEPIQVDCIFPSS